MPAFSLVFAPLLLALWLLRLYNAPLPLIEVLKLAMILGLNTLTRLILFNLVIFVVYNLPFYLCFLRN